MRVLLALSLVLSFAASGFAQSSEDEDSLSALAKRNKKKSEESKVITGDDLRRAGGKRRNAPESVPANPSSSGAADTEQAAGEGEGEAEPEKTEEETRADLKTEIQGDLAFHRGNIVTLRQEKQRAEAELADLATSTPSVTSTRRSRQMENIADFDRQIAEQEQAIAELEERARRAGIRL